MGQFITISIILYKENSQVHRFMWCEDISECTEYFLGVLVGFSIENVGLHEVKLGKKERICKGLTDICLFLTASDSFVLNQSHL